MNCVHRFQPGRSCTSYRASYLIKQTFEQISQQAANSVDQHRPEQAHHRHTLLSERSPRAYCTRSVCRNQAARFCEFRARRGTQSRCGPQDSPCHSAKEPLLKKQGRSAPTLPPLGQVPQIRFGVSPFLVPLRDPLSEGQTHLIQPAPDDEND